MNGRVFVAIVPKVNLINSKEQGQSHNGAIAQKVDGKFLAIFFSSSVSPKGCDRKRQDKNKKKEIKTSCNEGELKGKLSR